MPELLNVIMRWLHISSVAALIGGILYGRMVMLPVARSLAEESREPLSDHAARLFRPIVLAATTGLILSGIYNLLSTPGHTPRYHMLIGIKMLLAAHVFASALLAGRPKNPRRSRMLVSALISGWVVILISAYLRRIF
jgi:uncharacterized membrane protein